MIFLHKFIIVAVMLSLWQRLADAQVYTSVAPLWLTSNFMRAGNRNVISSATGNAVDPIFTFTFSSPLPGVPNLAYGIGKYQGIDTLRDEVFEIRKLGLNSTSFRVQIDISGSTTILIMNIPYLAIDPNFPHHLNSFDNVPINYGRTLANITAKSTSTTFFTNTINYTQQAAGRRYTTFASPLDGNKILLYITSIQINATQGSPCNINVSSKVLTTNTYSFSIAIYQKVDISKIQFSMIVFNEDDVESSKKYVLVFYTWETTSAGGFVEVPSAFVDNFILGMTDFDAVDGACIISYNWTFTTVSGKFGVQLATSTPGATSYKCGLSRIKSTAFYMKTWQCPTQNPYFNLTSNLCQNGCSAYFFANTSVLQCQNCEWGCSKCVNYTFCAGCDSTIDFRVLKNISGKPTCLCMPGSYQDPVDPTNKVCIRCVANCLKCNSPTACDACNEVGGFIMTTDRKCKKCGYGCMACEEVPYVCHECKDGMFFDPAQQKCVCKPGMYPSTEVIGCFACSPMCAECTGPADNECTSCSPSSPVPYFDLTTGRCQDTCGDYFYEDKMSQNCLSCPMGCNKCEWGVNCTACDLDRNKRMLAVSESGMAECRCIQGFYQDPNDRKNIVCLECNISNCLACDGEKTCTLCDDLTGYVLNDFGQCDFCGYGCLSCNATDCQKCSSGMIYDAAEKACVCFSGTYPSNVSVSCLACDSSCGACAGPSSSECKNCSNASRKPFYNTTTRQCQSFCGGAFYENWKTFNCSECPVGCNSCTSDTNCTKCDLDTNTRNLVTIGASSLCLCIEGFYQDQIDARNKVCLQCDIPNCFTCNGMFTCTLCDELAGYALDATGQCNFCGYGCLSCNATDCQECKKGMVYDGDQKKCVCLSGTYESNLSVSCLACDSSCGACTGPSSSECSNCSRTSTRPFFNSTTRQCQSSCGEDFYENWLVFDCSECPVGCNRCSSGNNCTKCGPETDKRSLVTIGASSLCACIQGFYQDPNNTKNKICLKCNISNCVACNSSTVCTKCENKLPGFGLTSAGQCVSTCGYGCDACSLKSRCITCAPGFAMNIKTFRCNCLANTFPSTVNVSCLSCHSKCKTCSGPSEFNCTSCKTENSTAPYFNATISTCEAGCGLYFFENVTAFECQKCNFNCRDCGKNPQCTECDLRTHFRKLIARNGQRTCSCIAGFYQDPENSSNPVCQKCIENCLTCRDNSTCDACNEAGGFILAENKTCLPCGSGCVSCNETTRQCSRCRAEFQLNALTKQCQCPDGTAKAANGLTCTACHPICKTCAGPSQYECLTCSTDQNRISLRQSNSFVHCVCDPFAYTEPTDGSLNCVKKTVESCDRGFIFIREQKKCIEICGDGQNFGTYKCDDGNIVDGDGCSKTCQVEQDFDCKKVDGTDTCFYVGVVNIVKAKAYKYPFSNNLLIQCKLDPIKNFFYSIDWKAGIMLIGPQMEVLDSWMEGEWLNINTTYFEDLSGKTLTIKYSTSLAKNKTPRSSARSLFESVFDFDITLRDYELPIVPANNIKPTYLEEDTYETVKEVQQALFTTATCVIVMILAAFALKTVFPFWQLVFSLQAIFLSLGVINYMNPLLTGLTEFSVVKGLRSTKIYFESLVSPSTAIEYNVASLGYVSSFFGNMNIMMFIWIALILTSGALFLMSKKDLAMGFPFQFCKRSLMLLVLFSSMGYAFSVGLITSNYPFELLVATICGTITVVQIYNLLKHMKLYYHFDQTFDLANKKIKYVVAMIIFTRIGQALVISLFRTNTFIAACIILAAQVLLTVGFIVFRPYTRALFNLLNIVGELAVTGFMAINLVLNLELIHDIEVESMLSYGQISLNFLVVLLMLGCFVYSIVVDFCIKDKHLTTLKFDDFEVDKSKPFNAYKNSSNVSKKQYNLKIEDFQDEDQSDVVINYRDNRMLIISK